MALTLYTTAVSPPSRAVLLTAAALGVKLIQKNIDLGKFETRTPEFIKINPQHTIPVLDDDGFIIWDSHAINVYLISKYGKYDALYPKDIKVRALVDQRLHFDTGVLFGRLANAVRPLKYNGEKAITEIAKQDIFEAYGFLNTFLHGNQFIAGDQLTIADFSAVTSATTLDKIYPIDSEEYPNIAPWIKRLESLPYYSKVQDKGLNDFEQYINSLLS